MGEKFKVPCRLNAPALPACRDMGAAAIAAGVAAQYLQLRPDATPSEVRRALVGMATPHTVTGVGSASTASLLFTNLSEALDATAAAPRGGSSGLSTGAAVGIAIAGLGEC